MFFTFCSCDVSIKHELLIKNNSSKNVYLFCSELDPTINNLWLYEYSQKYYHTNNDSFLNIRGVIKPKSYDVFKYDYPNDRLKDYILYIYYIKYDSLLLLKKKDFDSTLISRFLLKKCVVKGDDIFKQKKLEVCYP